MNKLSMPPLGDKVRTVKVAYIDEYEEEEIERKAARKKRVVFNVEDGMQTFLYDIELPITSSGVAEKKSGLALKEMKEGILSEASLEVDSLRYVSLEEEVIRNQKLECSCDEAGNDGSMQVLNEKDITFSSGVVVSSVTRGELAWDLGIRAGDVLVATSATIGDKIWPKSTMEGVRSAISSRKVLSNTIQIQLKRAGEVDSEAELVQEFEMSLSRPMGIHIEDNKDGYVRVSGFTDDAPDHVTNTLKIGDRIIAVDSSLGSKMWPVSNVEGVVSAVTTRLPGQPVQIRFERTVEERTNIGIITEPKVEEQKKILAESLRTSYSRFSNQEARVESGDLLSRCRDVLKRYISVHIESSNVPALVAERVMESLAEASASLDAKTLSLVMNAYITCNQPKDALKAFEAAVGLKADGSQGTPDSKKSGIVPNESGLHLYTVTDVIRCHAMLNDSTSALRVLASIEQNNSIDKTQINSWSCDIQADTKCYNAVLTAAVNSNDIENANVILDQMYDANGRSTKNLITYNIMIGAYARSGRREEAFDLFNTMRGVGIKPDKFTITALINAVVKEGDFDVARTLLQDMKKAGIQADVVSYNTVIGALCKKSSWFEAKELVAEMESDGVNPDSKTYGLLMNGLLKLNKPGPCLTLFESACADQRTAGLMENVQLYTTAITAAATLGDSERAFELISRMNFAGVKPNMKTLTALISACISDNKFDYAIDVFNKMKKPDGHAQALAIRAYCGLNDFETALAMIQNSSMTGKQTMLSYNYIIGSALDKENYMSAQMVMDNLLLRGFIPSKKTLQIVTNSLQLFKNKKYMNENSSKPDQGNEKFKFLLSVLDSFDRRKLQFSGQFYAGLLFEGARVGGIEKSISSLISESKINVSQVNVQIDGDTSYLEGKRAVTWIEMLEEYTELKGKLDELILPSVRVKLAEREIRQVLVAERGVTYRRRRRKSNRLQRTH